MLNRRLLHTAIALVFAGSLAACGSDSSSQATTAPTTAATTAAAATTASTTSVADPYGYGTPSATDAPATTVAAPATTATAASAAPAGSSLALATDPKFGAILVDAQGFSMYMFKKDTGTATACTGKCATAWPAADVAGAPTVGAGLDASKVGVAAQADGTMQLTYAGHLLYRFSGDSAPGQVNGQETGEVWYLLDAAGAQIGS
jgi:predicted lipoprotein with Yx(FWY)xxD motif